LFGLRPGWQIPATKAIWHKIDGVEVSAYPKKMTNQITDLLGHAGKLMLMLFERRSLVFTTIVLKSSSAKYTKSK
jgi:hypothetical protein